MPDGLIDVHCHILPGLDDGPTDLEGALALARAAVAAGTAVTYATPHVSDAHPNSARVVLDATARLREALADEAIPLTLASGAELALDHAAGVSDAELSLLGLGASRLLLVECPPHATADALDRDLRTLAARGFAILLAHVERVPALAGDVERLRGLVADGMRVQVTAASFSGRFGGSAQDAAERLLRTGLVDVVASDAHHAERRGPAIRRHMRAAGFGAFVEPLARDAPATLLGEADSTA